MSIEDGFDKKEGASRVAEAYSKYLVSGNIKPVFEAIHKEVLKVEEHSVRGFIGRLMQPVATWVSVKGFQLEERIRKI